MLNLGPVEMKPKGICAGKGREASTETRVKGCRMMVEVTAHLVVVLLRATLVHVLGPLNRAVLVELFVVGNGRELALHGGLLKSLGPREGVSDSNMRSLERRRADRLAFGASRSNGTLLGSSGRELLVVDGPGDNTLNGVTNSLEGALMRIKLEAVDENLKGVVRHGGEMVEKRLAVENKIGENRVRFGRDVERVTSKKNVQHADPESPNIGFPRLVSANSVVLFGSHVAVAANSALLGNFLSSCQSEVADLGISIFIEKDVFRLQIAVVDAPRVHVLEGIDKLKHEGPNVLGRNGGGALADGFIEVSFRAELKDEEVVVLVFEVIEQVDDVRVRAELGVEKEFLVELINGEPVGGRGGRSRLDQALDSDALIVNGIFGEIDHAEGPLVEELLTLIASIQSQY